MSINEGNNTPTLAGVRWNALEDAAALCQEACRRILDAAERAIKTRRRFLIVLAGGNTPRGAYRLLRSANTDWRCWQVYFSDERCLPTDNPERNSKMAAESWLDHVSIADNNVHVIAAELGADVGAHAYTETLRDVGHFDLVLLGLGEDGHTASLFPGHDCGKANDAPDTLAIFDAPKPPPQRISLSAARLSRCNEVVFLVEGETKREAVRRWRAGDAIPARAIRPIAGVDVLIERSLLLPT